MAKKLSDDELFCFCELLMSSKIDVEALVQILVDKGVITKEELRDKVRLVQRDMLNQKK